MCLKNELRKLLQEDQSFRLEILELLRDELNDMVTIEVFTDTPSGSTETDVSVNVQFQELSEDEVSNLLRSDFNKIAHDGFSYFWKKVTKDQRKRKDSCKKMFIKMLELSSIGMKTPELYLKNLNQKSQQFINVYEEIKKTDKILPYEYLENIIDSMSASIKK